jgi:phosphatidylinositol alpha-1,6-mannosyltransferase
VTGDHAAHSPDADTPGDAAREAHDPWPSRRLVSIWFACFAVYSVPLALFAGGEDGTWGAWGFGTYAIVALLLRITRGDRWWPALSVAAFGSLVAPFIWLVATGSADPAEVTVMARGAAYLLRHGTPYLPLSQLTAWTSYNPYLPLMDLFGLPRAAGLPRILGDPRIYTSLVTIALLAASFTLVARHSIRTCGHCRARAARMTAIAVTSPIIGFPLVLGITDPPVIAVTILALAFLRHDWLLRTALAVAAACALKYTAWPEVPVFAAMIWARHSLRKAAEFTVATLGAAAALALAGAPNALSDTGSIVRNTLDYPLGLTKVKTVAASPLPGHLIATLAPAGKTVAVTLLLLAGLAFAIWLVRRPPTTYQAVAVRLAVAYTLMFTLAPATRYGYYIYPLSLLGWLALTHQAPDTKRLRLTRPPGPDSSTVPRPRVRG